MFGYAANSAIRQIGGALGAAGAVLLVGQAGAGLGAFQVMDALLAATGSLTALLSLPVDTKPRR